VYCRSFFCMLQGGGPKRNRKKTRFVWTPTGPGPHLPQTTKRIQFLKFKTIALVQLRTSSQRTATHDYAPDIALIDQRGVMAFELKLGTLLDCQFDGRASVARTSSKFRSVGRTRVSCSVRNLYWTGRGGVQAGTTDLISPRSCSSIS
jgi:hypothetical protein